MAMQGKYTQCSFCSNPAEYVCAKCGQLACAQDVHIRAVCIDCNSVEQQEYQIHQAVCEDSEALEELVTLFWGNPVQLMFDESFRVVEQPAFVAESANQIVGFLFYTPFRERAVLIVAVGVLPKYQGKGIGKALIARVEAFAKDAGRSQLLVVTTNDNLPALAFYQRLGFQLFEVVPDIIGEKLGGLQPGVAKIPIRDELRLRKALK